MLPRSARTIGPSWRGHLALIKDLGLILSKNHKLKELTVDFVDKTLDIHVGACWNNTNRCDFREQLREAFHEMGKVHSVKKVTILGLPKALAQELKNRIQSPPTSFLDLPAELRNVIYEQCGDWSEISNQIQSTLANWTRKGFSPPYPGKLKTPTILLLNKQITHEAKSILRAKPLRLTYESATGMNNSRETISTLRFIGVDTIPHVQHLDISVEVWEWMYSFSRFWPALASTHNLKTLTISFKDILRKNFLQSGKKYPDQTLHQCLSGLQLFRGIGCVTFKGDLPDAYTDPLKTIMESPKGTEKESLPALKAITRNGYEVDI